MRRCCGGFPSNTPGTNDPSQVDLNGHKSFTHVSLKVRSPAAKLGFVFLARSVQTWRVARRLLPRDYRNIGINPRDSNLKGAIGERECRRGIRR